MTAANRRQVDREVSKKSGAALPRARRKGITRSRPFGVLCALALVLGLGLQLGMVQTASAATAPVGNDFVVTTGDLSFILKQIKIAERHTTTLTGSNPCGTLVAQPGDGIPDSEQIPDYLTAYGLRTVDGSCNNLKSPATARFAAADEVFPRLTAPKFIDADTVPGGPETAAQPPFTVPARGPVHRPGSLHHQLQADQRQRGRLPATHHQQPDRRPDLDQPGGRPRGGLPRSVPRAPATPRAVPCTTDPDPGNPNVDPAVPPAAGVPAGCTPSHKTLFIPNVTTDVGLSPPFNSIFTFFGQFFDHGVDQTVKTGDLVFVPLKADDPLITLGPDGKPNTGDEVNPQAGFMVLTRAQVKAGPDGVLGTDDDGPDNTDTPWVDQSQTYTSHASHQVFLREYVPGTGTPGVNNAAAVATGKLLTGLPADQTYPGSPDMTGGESTWASVKKQAHDLLGLQLVDLDVANIPMLATDPYGKYLPGPHGLPQYVTQNAQLHRRCARQPGSPSLEGNDQSRCRFRTACCTSTPRS